MKLVKIEQCYTDFLRKVDNRVSFNVTKIYERPYIGILFKINKKLLYFAPLTSSGKGKKLKNNPKKESITFYPIKKCSLGGINFNNMIPVVKGMYKIINVLKVKDLKLKNLYFDQINELSKVEKHLIVKAHTLYNLKNANKLYENYDKVTCNFKLLEKRALKFKKKIKM